MSENSKKKQPVNNGVDVLVEAAMRKMIGDAAPADAPAKKRPSRSGSASRSSNTAGEKTTSKSGKSTRSKKVQEETLDKADKKTDKKVGSAKAEADRTGKTGKSAKVSKNRRVNKVIQEQDEAPYQAYQSNKLARNDESAKAALRAHGDSSKKTTDREFKLRIIPLGGLGEVGKNMMLIQYGADILVVDGGLSFPDGDMYGVDLVIPDYSYLIENKENVRAFVLTHGHEDHIGAMPYILNDVEAPVYGAALTLGLLQGKLDEHQVRADLRVVSDRQEIQIGPFKIEFIRLTHSIPDTMGVAIHTPVGTLLFISDFKMDMSPIDGKLMDFGRISAFGEKGVLLLMSDSTNAEVDGFTSSERTVGAKLEKLFMDTDGRIILTSFASHVHRIQQAIWAAQRNGRKVAVCGRGMQNMVNVAGGLGYLEFPDNCLIDIDRINDYPDSKVCIITTGSQGEILSGLSRMASGEHRQVQIRPGDTVIISATPIPGNELTVSRLVDNLFRHGARVIYERSRGIHVSGHANREELKVLLNLVKPRFFLPVHGEYRMLFKHAQLAQEVGMSPYDTIVLENGQILEMNRRKYRINGTVPSGRVFVDGLGVGDVGASVLRERRQLSEGGVIVVSMVYSKNKGAEPKILLGPEITTRGFIFEKEYEHIIGEMKDRVEALATPERLANGNLHDLRNQIRSMLNRFVMERTRRRPVIVTVIDEI